MITLIKAENYEDMSKKGADQIAEEVKNNPSCVLGLATGSTPLGMYGELVRRSRQQEISFQEVVTVNLDEYKGLTKENQQSYYYFMHDNFFRHIDIDPEKTHVPDGMAADPAWECRNYDNLVADLGGADLQLLGIGRNGHIGFNEPSDIFPKGTHVVDLEQSTIEANQRFFKDGEQVPRQAYSMGIGTIMSAKKILLLASGEDKAWAVKQLLQGEVSPKVPCTILQFHSQVVVVADQAACSLL